MHSSNVSTLSGHSSAQRQANNDNHSNPLSLLEQEPAAQNQSEQRAQVNQLRNTNQLPSQTQPAFQSPPSVNIYPPDPNTSLRFTPATPENQPAANSEIPVSQQNDLEDFNNMFQTLENYLKQANSESTTNDSKIINKRSAEQEQDELQKLIKTVQHPSELVDLNKPVPNARELFNHIVTKLIFEFDENSVLSVDSKIKLRIEVKENQNSQAQTEEVEISVFDIVLDKHLQILNQRFPGKIFSWKIVNPEHKRLIDSVKAKRNSILTTINSLKNNELNKKNFSIASSAALKETIADYLQKNPHIQPSRIDSLINALNNPDTVQVLQLSNIKTGHPEVLHDKVFIPEIKEGKTVGGYIIGLDDGNYIYVNLKHAPGDIVNQNKQVNDLIFDWPQNNKAFIDWLWKTTPFSFQAQSNRSLEPITHENRFLKVLTHLTLKPRLSVHQKNKPFEHLYDCRMAQLNTDIAVCKLPTTRKYPRMPQTVTEQTKKYDAMCIKILDIRQKEAIRIHINSLIQADIHTQKQKQTNRPKADNNIFTNIAANLAKPPQRINRFASLYLSHVRDKTLDQYNQQSTKALLQQSTPIASINEFNQIKPGAVIYFINDDSKKVAYAVINIGNGHFFELKNNTPEMEFSDTLSTVKITDCGKFTNQKFVLFADNSPYEVHSLSADSIKAFRETGRAT